MEKRQIIYYLKKRWNVVHKIEIRELQHTSLSKRFKKTLLLFDFGMNLPKLFDTKKDSEILAIRQRWQKLRSYFNETK